MPAPPREPTHVRGNHLAAAPGAPTPLDRRPEPADCAGYAGSRSASAGEDTASPLLGPASADTIRPERLWSRDFALLLLSNLIFFTGFHLLLPSMPVYAVRLGGGEMAAGLVGAAISMSALLVRPMSGWVVDVTGRRMILLMGTAFVALSILAHQWIAGVALLVALRFAHGLGFGVATTAGGTLASDLVPRHRLGEGMGFYTMSMSLPMVAAPALGIGLATRGEFTTLFVLAAALTAGSFALALLLRPPRFERPASHPGRPSFAAFYEADALFGSVLVTLLTATYGILLALLALHGEQRGIGSVGLFFTVYAVVLTSTRAWAGRLADGWGYRQVAAVGLLFAALGLVVLAAAGALWSLLAAAVFYGLGFGSAQPSMQAMALERVLPSRRGAATAMYFTAFDVGVVIGSLTGGFLAGFIGLGAVMALASLMPLFGLCLLFAARAQRQARTFG
jgi:MFS family permease